ncbi:glycerate kinase type-2 family protein [Paracoccus jiaweipingae]|uniref:glycerate kinase type-2 family protein n=1 Tax=unclassified Paracoccus (in: a-proteobacteria) TaxID=2688777 RepID=UPI0037A6A8FF
MRFHPRMNHDALSETALGLIRAGIAAADPFTAVAGALPGLLAQVVPVGGWRVLAVGKAAPQMARAALTLLPGVPALAVTHAGNDRPLPGAMVLRAGHPEPDAQGLAAAHQVAEFLSQGRAGQAVLALISGGGSAMLPAPVPGVTLADKIAVNRLLLGSGLDIIAMNRIRQALSVQKGGGWLRLSPAPVCTLILSDVPGDDPRVVASGPSVAPIGTLAQAADLARQAGLWSRLPPAVQRALTRPQPPAPPPGGPVQVVGSNAISLRAMAAAGARSAPRPLTGEVATCAPRLLAAMRDLRPGQALAFGGETTVRLGSGPVGQGGRNQELALRLALAEAAAPLGFDWRFAALGSDGRDGPGQAAGAVVGPETLARMRAAGLDPQAALRAHDSGPALAAAGALVMTGSTGTNVADLAVALRAQ